MVLCKDNPQLLGSDLGNELVNIHAGKQDILGDTALVYLFESKRISEVDFYTIEFKMLWDAEHEIKDVNGLTPESILKMKPNLHKKVI